MSLGSSVPFTSRSFPAVSLPRICCTYHCELRSSHVMLNGHCRRLCVFLACRARMRDAALTVLRWNYGQVERSGNGSNELQFESTKVLSLTSGVRMAAGWTVRWEARFSGIFRSEYWYCRRFGKNYRCHLQGSRTQISPPNTPAERSSHTLYGRSLKSRMDGQMFEFRQGKRTFSSPKRPN